LSMALYSPNGTSFGRFASKDVDFQSPKSELPQNLNSIEETPSSYKFFSKVNPSHPQCSQCDKSGTSKNGEYYYVLESEISKGELAALLANTKNIFGFLTLCNLLLALLFSRLLSRRLVRNVETAVERVRHIKQNGGLNKRISLEGKDEVSYLTREFDHLLDSIEENRQTVIEAEKAQAKIKMARDVAHNIRSPILAIEMMLPNLFNVPENLKKVLQTSVNEIKGLSEKLSRKNEFGEFDLKRKDGDHDLIFLPVFLEEIVNQKQIELSRKPGLKIVFENKGDVSSEFIKVNALELKSIISNLLNNSVESYGDKNGIVVMSCQVDEKTCQVKIRDSGAGIPNDYLDRLGKERITFKGDLGRGLGLLQATKTIRLWKGDFSINSQIGVGTEVVVTLPRHISHEKKMINENNIQNRVF